jgi:cytochrome P450
VSSGQWRAERALSIGAVTVGAGRVAERVVGLACGRIASGLGRRTGTAALRAPGNADVVNPVVVCEGFPGGYPYDYVYDCLSAHGTLDEMFTRGFDLVVVSFTNGADQMQKNADVVVAAIRQALTRAHSSNGAAQPLVTGGVSMGGLVARYALALMESRGIDHGTRLFFSIDSPHTGAYTSVADQWLLHYLAPASSLAEVLSELVNSPANQQFMVSWVDGDEAIVSPLRTLFLRDLEGIGSWPSIPKKIGMSNGRGDGKRTIDPGAQMLEWGGGPFASARLFALPEGSTPGLVGEAYCFRSTGSEPHSLTTTSKVSWEGAPGGLNTYNAMAAGVAQGIGIGALNDDIPVTLCIPALSALGMNLEAVDPFAPIPPPGSGVSPFDDYCWCPENTHHIHCTPEISQFLLGHLGTPVVEPLPLRKPGAVPPFNPASFNPHDPAFSKDPYPTYRQFREHAPVHWVEPYESYWVFRHDDIMRVLDGSENFNALTYAKNRYDPPSPPAPGPFDVLSNFPEGLFSLDPPRHGEVRSMMDGYLQRLLAQVPVVASLIARQLLVTAKESGRIELYNAYALPLPSSTLFTLMGIPKQDWMGLMSWVGGVQAGHDITQPASLKGLGGTCAMAMGTYFQGLTKGTTDSKCPVHADAGGLFSMMVTEGMGTAPKMSPEEVQQTSVNLAIAGYLSTTFLIATGMLDLLGGAAAANGEAPAGDLPIDILRKNPQLMSSAINEMLRYDSPFQMTDRFVVNRSTTLGGTKLRIGDPITLVFGSANRDETVYKDPDKFDIARQGPPHLGFGAGIHRCYGAPLVEAVAPVAFQMLLQELRSIRLAGTPQWQTDPYIRSVTNLPLEID